MTETLSSVWKLFALTSFVAILGNLDIAEAGIFHYFLQPYLPDHGTSFQKVRTVPAPVDSVYSPPKLSFARTGLARPLKSNVAS